MQVLYTEDQSMMSQNPQWNHFQPPPVPSADSAILDFNKPYSSYSNNNMFNVSSGSPVGSFPSKPNKTFSPNAPPFTPSNSGDSGFDIGNFSIGTFDPSNCYSSSDSGVGNGRSVETNGYHSNNTYINGSSSPNAQGMRETGIIEKLLHSYGFIQCCERQARLFFHFSQFEGTIEHLHIGDPVEFEMTYDRRTGKPIASTVSKIAPEVVLSEERVMGTVTTELAEGVTHGRISYENRGECFFLPYAKEDVEGSTDIHSGDVVTFQIATNQRSGTLAAHNVRLDNPAVPIRYQGVICSMKDNFGFIERADVVKEIFFHFSESKQIPQLGDDVEFAIQTRNGKEVATEIVHLPVGTVVFEDLIPEIVKGQVLKSLERGNTRFQADPLPGRIRYRGKDRSEVEIPFGTRDQLGEFTLKHGDWVKFNVAIDRRDQLQRATNIQLLSESFVASGEKREQGTVLSIKDSYGFIKCAERETNVFFHLSEILEVDAGIKVDDEVEFTVTQDASVSTRYSALRIRVLDPGTVTYETGVRDDVDGTIVREPATQWAIRSSPVKGAPNNGSGDKVAETGMIAYQLNGSEETIPFYHKDCNLRNSPKIGDKVKFNIRLVKRSKEVIATDIQVTERNIVAPLTTDVSDKNKLRAETYEPKERNSGPSTAHQGFVAALKDGFGFIETITHDKEIFFHFSNFDGDASNLQMGQEVEYTVSAKAAMSAGKVSAENVKVLPKGSLPTLKLKEEIYEGMVIRPLRSVNPDQPHYAGLIQMAGEGKDGQFEFGITSLSNKKEFLQRGDQVTFQVEEGVKRAGNIKAMRKKLQATVDAIKGQFGFLSFEVEEGKKLFFHMTEVRDGATLKEGDQVEFYVFTNQRTNKSSACQVTKLSGGQRPERLISRIRSISLDESRPRMIVLRQPRGPDGSRGFKCASRKISTMSAP